MLIARISLRAKLLLAPLVAIAALGSVSLVSLHVLDHETDRAADAIERNLSALKRGAAIAPALAESQTAARHVALGLVAGQPAKDIAAARDAARAGLARAADAVASLADDPALPPATADAVRAFGFELRPYRLALGDLLDSASAPDPATLATMMATTERQADRLQRHAGELADSLAAAAREDALAGLVASRGWLRGLVVILGMALLPCLALAFFVERRALADISLLAQLVERLRISGHPVEAAARAASAGLAGDGAAADGGRAGIGATPAGAARVPDEADAIHPPRPADFTGAVEALAFRGNLLALNAAVEAARHARPGNAIATVAEDARRLAQAATLMADECRWQQRLADLDAAARAARRAARSGPAATSAGMPGGLGATPASAGLNAAPAADDRLPARPGACFTAPSARLRHDLGRED